MNTLPRYSGELACCEKCDGADAHTQYHPEIGGFDVARLAIDNAPPHAEFLARECARCGYKWAEACIDQAELAREREQSDEWKREVQDALRASRERESRGTSMAAEDAARCPGCAGTGTQRGSKGLTCASCAGSGTRASVACDACLGHGSTRHGKTCTTCNGTRVKP